MLDPVISARALASLRAPVILDCRPDADAYAAGHLPGALHAQLERDLSAPTPTPAQGGRHPLPDIATFAARLGAWGITPSSHVLLYDDQGGANAAARAWWMLRAAGHERVQVIDGGLSALRAAGHSLTSEPAHATPASPYPTTGFAWGLAAIDEVERARTDAARSVLDVRAGFRFRGESEPLDPVAGHIPGARNLPYGENLRGDGTFKSHDELRALYDGVLDGREPSQLIVHCGSGVTACHTLLALARAGLPGARLYVGSWSEWCRNPERARAQGEA